MEEVEDVKKEIEDVKKKIKKTEEEIEALPKGDQERALQLQLLNTHVTRLTQLEKRINILMQGAGPAGGGSGAGLAEAMQESVRELKAVTSQLRHVMLENQSQTRSASKISFGDVRHFQVAASLEVIGDGDISFDKLNEKKPEADGFEWDTRPESQQADRYIPFWVERLEQTATQQQQPWPVGMLRSHWRDVCSMGYIRFHHRQCRFPLPCKNDVLLCFTPYNSDAIMGVKMKKKLDDQALREAELEFYTWDSYVPGPFLQLVTDLCRGGVVFWCSGVRGPGPVGWSNKITIWRQLLSNMNQVYEFVTKAVHSLPDHVVKRQPRPAGEQVLPEPRRVKFFNPMMMTIPEELEEREAESSSGGSSSGPDASGGARGAEPSRKLPEPSGGRSSKGGTSRHFISLERSRQLARLLDRLRANDDDVANLRDVADID